MTDKKVVIILILMVVYIWLVKPQQSNIVFKKFELKNIEKAIQKEKFIISKEKEIKKLYPKFKETVNVNTSLFYSSNIPISIAMSKVQQSINAIALKDSVNLINTNWGSYEAKNGYIVMPLSLIFKCNPVSLEKFIRDIISYKKIMRFRSLYISTYGKGTISVRAIIIAFKLKNMEK